MPKKALRMRLYPTEAQVHILNQYCGSGRYIYNRLLDETQALAKSLHAAYLTAKAAAKPGDKISRPRISAIDLHTRIKVIRDTDPTVRWLKRQSMCSLRKAADALSIAYDRYFGGVSKFPKFKSRYDKRGFRIDSEGWSRVQIRKHSETGKFSYIRLEQFPGLLADSLRAKHAAKDGIFDEAAYEHQLVANLLLKVRFDNRAPLVDGVRQFPGRVTEVSFSMTPDGKWFISFLCEVPHTRSNPDKTAVVGIDLGIKTQIVASDGSVLENMRFLKRDEKALAKWQRAMARRRKPKGTPQSKRYLYAKRMVAKIHARIVNRREHHIHCYTTALIRRSRVVVIEDLNVSGMMQNHHTAKAMADESPRRIRTQLEYKAALDGITTIMVADRWCPSSHICHACNKLIGRKLKLTERGWTCPHCGVSHDRDFNASMNLKQLGEEHYLEAHKLPGGVVMLPAYRRELAV